jgi:tetratricopeptide (TPR) repeat protein
MPVELADSYEAIYRRAIMQMAAGKLDEAIASMLRIVNRLRRLRPETLARKPNLQDTLLSAWQGVIQFLRWEERYDQAIAVCESVLEHLPDPDDGRRRIASLMIERGDVEDGLARMRQIGEERPSFGSWSDLGAEHLILKRYDEAEAFFQSALSLAGSNEEAATTNVSLFRVYQESDRVDQALGAWSMAVVLNPDMGDEVYQVYGWLIERGHLEEAKKYLERERTPIRHAFFSGLIDWQVGDQDAARQKWRDVLEMEIDEQGTGIEAWIEAALRLGEPQKAVDLDGSMFDRSTPVSIKVTVLMGTAYAMLDEVQDAGEWFDQALVRLQRGWPSRDKVPATEWALFASLVSNEDIVQRMAAYFEV